MLSIARTSSLSLRQLRSAPLPIIPPSHRCLSYSAKQKLKKPTPDKCTDEEYEAQVKIVAELRAKCDEITKQVKPLQVQESELRKKEQALWMKVRAIRRYLCEQGEKENMEYLEWEVKTRTRRDEEERQGLRRPLDFQTLMW